MDSAKNGAVKSSYLGPSYCLSSKRVAQVVSAWLGKRGEISFHLL